MSEDNKEQANRAVQGMLFTSGIAFICVGAYGLMSPQVFESFLDIESGRILSGCLILAGFGDFFLAKFIFSSKDRK